MLVRQGVVCLAESSRLCAHVFMTAQLFACLLSSPGASHSCVQRRPAVFVNAATVNSVVACSLGLPNTYRLLWLLNVQLRSALCCVFCLCFLWPFHLWPILPFFQGSACFLVATSAGQLQWARRLAAFPGDVTSTSKTWGFMYTHVLPSPRPHSAPSTEP